MDLGVERPSRFDGVPLPFVGRSFSWLWPRLEARIDWGVSLWFLRLECCGHSQDRGRLVNFGVSANSVLRPGFLGVRTLAPSVPILAAGGGIVDIHLRFFRRLS